MEVSERLLSLIKDLRKTVVVIWAEDYQSAYELLERIKDRYGDILHKVSALRERINSIENEVRRVVREEWGAERILENREGFKEEIRKRVSKRILEEVRYSHEDMLAVPLMRYLRSLDQRVSELMKSEFSKKTPRRNKIENCIFTTRKVYERTYEIKGYWITRVEGVPKLDAKLFLKNYRFYLEEALSEVEFKIHSEMLDVDVQSDEKSGITGGSLLVADHPQIITLTFTVDNEKLRLRAELKGEEKYKKAITTLEFIIVIGKSFIRSLTF